MSKVGVTVITKGGLQTTGPVPIVVRMHLAVNTVFYP